ncbi:MAG: hypothetical protein JO112_20575, partial [Planctomycetes bacterium]|nr:hypothetical protein [Planctomycetota bacterium]
MSFLHYLFLGHFEHNGNTVRFSKSASNPVYHPVVLRSLDREAIKATLQENQGRNGEDLVFPENWGIWLEEGYLVCDKYTKVEEAIHFITRLVERTDCEIYDVSARCEISLKDWLTVVDGSPGQPLSSLDVQGRDSGNTRTDQPMEAPSQQAFILRIAPSRSDRVPEALQRDRVYIGWSKAEGLLDAKLDWGQFRQIIRNTCYSQEQDFRRSGKAAGEMWRFIRKMRPGDLVVVPHSTYFYVAEVQGLPEYDPSRISEDLAYSRPVL